MEHTDNTLAYRQLDVVRKNLLAVFRFAVKALIDKACFCSIDDGCEEFINFCATMEHVLQHRLRPSKAWYLGDDRSHFWFYIKAACHRNDLRGCITNLDNIENIKSPIAKGRAFLRCALMEKRLSEYLGEALRQINITKRYYKPGAIMLGEEASEMCGVLLGLNSIDFGFCVKGENYDTVECPLAISYTPFMKFKQSQESLHSDLEEMRELSCGSSLASEDGHDPHDAATSDTWSDRYNALHKRYMRLMEQKSFLEEVTASQEKALQAAAAMQQEMCSMQRDAAAQKQQYEGVILELQAQVARMKTINESLQQQLTMARSSRIPLTEMERRGDRDRERGVEASRFAAAMVYKQDSDRHSLTSSYDHSSTGTKTVDTRSLTSAVSEFSVDTPGAGISHAREPSAQVDSYSMVPLTGSLGDLHLDLESGNVSYADSSAVTNPEQSTPVVSVSSGMYSTVFVETAEVNGNENEDNLYIREPVNMPAGETAEGDGQPFPKSTSGDRAVPPSARAEDEESSGNVSDPASTPAASLDQRGESTDLASAAGHDNVEREEDGRAEGGAPQAREELTSAPIPQGDKHTQSLLSPPGKVTDDHRDTDTTSQASKTSEPEELLPEDRMDDGEGATSERNISDTEIPTSMVSSKESGGSSSGKDESSELEHLSQDSVSDLASGEHRKDSSEPEILSQGEVTDPRDESSGDEKEQGVGAEPLAEMKEASEVKGQQSGEGEGGEKSGAHSGSESGSSDENKDTWDMLSDATHDSS